MENTTTQGTTSPASNNASTANPGNIAAISSAISQAVPPNRSNVQTPAQSQVRENSSNQSRQSNVSQQDKVLSLEDFDATGEENPFTPKPRDTKPVVEKSENNRLQREVQKQAPENEENKQKESDTSNKEEETNGEENKLELEIDLNENADPIAKQKEKELVEQNKGKRDYTKFKPEHAEFLKKLPNHLFAKASEEITKLYGIEQENNQLKEKLKNSTTGKLPENYYEHENAYQLSPEYGNISRELEYDSFEERHWQAQLANIKRGLPWHNLLGYDQKTGAPHFQKVEALKDAEGNPVLDVDNELKVTQFLQAVGDLKRQHVGTLETLRQGHKLEYQKSREGLDGLKKQFFSAFLDESKLPPNVKADLQLAKDAINKDMPAFKNNPAMELLIYAYAALKAQNRQIVKMAQLFNQEKEKFETSRRAGPSKMDFQGGTANGDKILSASDFDD